MRDPPHVHEEVQEARGGNFRLDYTGFALVALAFGCLEVVLDKGQDDDWFGSGLIRTFAILAALGFVVLISWELREVRRNHRPILNLRLFLNRTFAISFGMMFVLGFALYGTTVLIPALLQTLMGYTAEKAGAALSFGGLATMVCMPVVGRLIGKVDPRYLIAFGFGSMGLALIYMGGMNLQMSFEHASLMRVYQAFGLGFLFVPIQTMSYADVPMRQNNDVSGLTNLARNVGGTCGTAFLVTMLARLSQRHQTYLTTRVAAGDPSLSLVSTAYARR